MSETNGEGLDLRGDGIERGRVEGGGVRWEHVDVTYVETRERTVRVFVPASTPLTQEALDTNAGYLTDLAVAVDRQHPTPYYKAPSTEYVRARSVGSEIAGGQGT